MDFDTWLYKTYGLQKSQLSAEQYHSYENEWIQNTK